MATRVLAALVAIVTIHQLDAVRPSGNQFEELHENKEWEPATPVVSVFDELWTRFTNQAPGSFSRYFGFASRDLEVHVKQVVVVVGAGTSGLQAALEAKRRGADVHVFERRSSKYTRNNVVALDPMVVGKLLSLGLPPDLFQLKFRSNPPLYPDVASWELNCLTDDALRDRDAGILEEYHQGHVKCSPNEGFLDDRLGWGYLRTRCLEEALYQLAMDSGVKVNYNSQFAGIVSDEDTSRHYALIRMTTSSTQLLFPADIVVLAVGASVRRQDKNTEFKRWYVVQNPSIPSSDSWFHKALASIESLKSEDHASVEFDALDLGLVYKDISTVSSPVGMEGVEGLLGASIDVYDCEPSALPTGPVIVTLGPAHSETCNNWLEKRSQHTSAKPALSAQQTMDDDLMKRFSFELNAKVNAKASYAMTAVFRSIGTGGLRGALKTTFWNVTTNSPPPFFFSHLAKQADLEKNEFGGGAKWLNGDYPSLLQIRMFPNKCLVYLGIGLTHETFVELTGIESPSPDKCEQVITNTAKCDAKEYLAVTRDEAVCNTILPYEAVAQKSQSGALPEKQLAMLRSIASKALLSADPLPSGADGVRWTIFPINLFKLDSTPPLKIESSLHQRLWLLGDAGHTPNFLTGSGVQAGQADADVFADFIAGAMSSGASTNPIGVCTEAKLKVIQAFLYLRGCAYSPCISSKWRAGNSAGLQLTLIPGLISNEMTVDSAVKDVTSSIQSLSANSYCRP